MRSGIFIPETYDYDDSGILRQISRMRDLRASNCTHLTLYEVALMHSFRMRLILALIASVTLVSVASTYFDVLAHRHVLRQDLERRTQWMGASIQPGMELRWRQAIARPFPD